MKPRLLLVEDHALVGEGIRAMLAGRYEVIGPVTNGDEVLEALATHRPAAVLLDLTLPGRNGLELIPEMVRADPTVRILVVSMHTEWVIARRALTTGATGFVPKDSSREELERAVTDVLAGHTHLSPRIGPSVPVGMSPSLRQAWLQLTTRHRQIVLGIAEGRNTAEIATALGLSQHTIHFHRRKIRRILGIESDDGLASTAMLIKLAGGTEKGGWGVGQ